MLNNPQLKSVGLLCFSSVSRRRYDVLLMTMKEQQLEGQQKERVVGLFRGSGGRDRTS